MSEDFPSAVVEIPVKNVAEAAAYYQDCLGFNKDWGEEGLGQVSRGGCRIFLADAAFREQYGTIGGPVVIWFNLNSKQAVDELYEAWRTGGALIVEKPESKPWHLHEFTATDQDGNLLRVFYDFAWELPERGGRQT